MTANTSSEVIDKSDISSASEELALGKMSISSSTKSQEESHKSFESPQKVADINHSTGPQEEGKEEVSQSLQSIDEEADSGVPDTGDMNNSSLTQEDQGSQSVESSDEAGVSETDNSSMPLEVAYQSLESLRKVNLQIEFGEVIKQNECVHCIREEFRIHQKRNPSKSWISRGAKSAFPCFMCGTPVCNKHRSSDTYYGKHMITCVDCAKLFDTEYLVTNILDKNEQDTEEQKKKINRILEVYDRVLLILKYSSQFINETVAALRKNSSRHNKIGLGSSTIGVAAGGLGVAAAATIMAPIGGHLLLASLLFGSGATFANAGSEAFNYRCEPRVMADRIMALYSIVNSISRIPAVMDGMSEDLIDNKNNKHGLGQSKLHWTRTAMLGLKTVTAGAISAVSIVTEAREMKLNIDKIRAKSPCEKATKLSDIQNEIDFLPSTEILSQQLSVVIKRAYEIGAE